MNPSSLGEGAGTMASLHCATPPLVENIAPPSSFPAPYNGSWDLGQCFQQQIPNSFPAPPISSSSGSYVHTLFLDFNNFVGNIIDNQEETVTSYLFLQNEQLQSVLNHQRMQGMVSIMRRFEMTTAVLMRQKDEELMNLNIKIKELLESLKASKEETKMWKRIAKENELIASVFSNAPEEERDPCFSSTGALPDEKIVPPVSASHGECWNQSVPGKSEQNSN